MSWHIAAFIATSEEPLCAIDEQSIGVANATIFNTKTAVLQLQLCQMTNEASGVNPNVDKAILQLFRQGPSPSLFAVGWAKGVDLHQTFTHSRLVLGLGLAPPCGSSLCRLLGGPETAPAQRLGFLSEPNIILLRCGMEAGAATQPANEWPVLPSGSVARKRLPRERKREPRLAQALPHLSLVPVRTRRIDSSPCMRQVQFAVCTLPPPIDGLSAGVPQEAKPRTPTRIAPPERREAAQFPKLTKKSCAPKHHATERKTYSLSAGSPCLCPASF
jgi:hypothetical protein